jgi:adiponectin receptor
MHFSSSLAVNIHSHWGGAALFVYLLCVHLPSVLATYDTDGAADLLYLLAFGLAAITCLFFSGTYHMAGCHSPKVPSVCARLAVKQKKLNDPQVHDFCHKLDYSGISILIVGSMYPCIYYAFYCHPSVRNFYLVSITVAGLGSSPFRLLHTTAHTTLELSGATYVTLSPEYSRPTHRRLRTYMFIGLGLSGVIPTIHSIHLHGVEHMREELGLDWILFMAALYITGALI